jgi:hypothetical protein
MKHTIVTSPGPRLWLPLAGGLTLAAVLLALPAVFSDEKDEAVRARLSEWRDKDPQGFAQAYHDAKAFLALPPERQKAVRALYKELQEQSPGEKERLTGVMKRYVEWLESLPEAERKKVAEAPDKEARLKVIHELRDKEWLDRQPPAIRDYVDKLPKTRPAPAITVASTLVLLTPPHLRPGLAWGVLQMDGDLHGEAIKRLKQDEIQKANDWLIARRFWDDLMKRTPMPAHAADFSPRVDTFVKHYLRPMLSKDEQERLDKAEGQWPLYPMTLVELADKHPIALPSRLGPTLYKELPEDVRKRLPPEKFEVKFDGKADKGKKKLTTPDAVLHYYPYRMPVEKRLESSNLHNASASTKFIALVIHFANKRDIKLLDDNSPYPEVWPTQFGELSRDMQRFLRDKGGLYTLLTVAEKDALERAAERGWPEYPLKIKELAARHGQQPPWYTLPDPDKHHWDRYRIKPREEVLTRAVLPGREPFWQAQMTPLSPDWFRL